MMKHTISGKANDKASRLQAKRHVKVFRDVVLTPEQLPSFIISESDALKSLPSEKCVVADKWGVVAVADGEADKEVDKIGKVRD